MTSADSAGQDLRELALWHSRRLWSLWEIAMKFFPAYVFLGTISNIDRHYEIFSKAYDPHPWSAKNVITEKDRKEFDALYENVESFCAPLELVAAVATLGKMRACLKDPKATYGDFFGLGPEFSGRFKDEMRNRHVYALTISETQLAEHPQHGWEEVAKGFPSAVYDIEESAYCLALERSTAAAFHGIRALEAAIRALSHCLGIPDPTKASDRSWFKLLKSVKDGIDLKWPGSSTRMSGDGEFFDNAYAALAAMQNPWRNATMHLDQKYTLEEARFVFDIVRGFMKKIASRMDENGDPKAERGRFS